MEESEDNVSADETRASIPSPTKKQKKRSLVERELETSLTARITSPVTSGDTLSRYGRARRIKTENDFIDPQKALTYLAKTERTDKTPGKIQLAAYKMHASNSPTKEPINNNTPKKMQSLECNLETQIENIYHENISLSRFGLGDKKLSPSNIAKVYVRKDLIQKRDKDDNIVLIKNMFSPSSGQTTGNHLNNILERSAEKFNISSPSAKSPSMVCSTPSVVKTLDFGSAKRKNPNPKTFTSKSEIFELEAKCAYQVGDLAWARMGTFPFWPCLITREDTSGLFVKLKLFGRVEHHIIHVTFFGDNGRHSWIVDSMLRKFLGQLEFEATREHFNATDKKKDPKLYAAFFVSEKKMPQWLISVEEAETLLREPKRLRIDLFNDMLIKSRSTKATTPKIHNRKSKPKKTPKLVRTASDVSLSESLYDTLFSEVDGQVDDGDCSGTKSRKSLDVSEVVTACLDNMAAKTGMTNIKKQSHMDRWLQKAKSKTPEKCNLKSTFKVKLPLKKNNTQKKKGAIKGTCSIRKSNESRNTKSHKKVQKGNSKNLKTLMDGVVAEGSGIGIISKVESLREKLADELSKAVAEMEYLEKDSVESYEYESMEVSASDIPMCESPTFTQEFDESQNEAEQIGLSQENIPENGLNETSQLTEEIEKENDSYEVFNGQDSDILDSMDASSINDVSIEINLPFDISSNIHKDNEHSNNIKDLSTCNGHEISADAGKDRSASIDSSCINSSDDLKKPKPRKRRSTINRKVKPIAQKRSQRIKNRKPEKSKEDSFTEYVELRQDAIMDEHPELSKLEVIEYLRKTWQYEQSAIINEDNTVLEGNSVNGIYNSTDSVEISEENLILKDCTEQLSDLQHKETDKNSENHINLNEGGMFNCNNDISNSKIISSPDTFNGYLDSNEIDKSCSYVPKMLDNVTNSALGNSLSKSVQKGNVDDSEKHEQEISCTTLDLSDLNDTIENNGNSDNSDQHFILVSKDKLEQISCDKLERKVSDAFSNKPMNNIFSSQKSDKTDSEATSTDAVDDKEPSEETVISHTYVDNNSEITDLCELEQRPVSPMVGSKNDKYVARLNHKEANEIENKKQLDELSDVGSDNVSNQKDTADLIISDKQHTNTNDNSRSGIKIVDDINNVKQMEVQLKKLDTEDSKTEKILSKKSEASGPQTDISEEGTLVSEEILNSKQTENSTDSQTDSTNPDKNMTISEVEYLESNVKNAKGDKNKTKKKESYETGEMNIKEIESVNVIAEECPKLNESNETSEVISKNTAMEEDETLETKELETYKNTANSNITNINQEPEYIDNDIDDLMTTDDTHMETDNVESPQSESSSETVIEGERDKENAQADANESDTDGIDNTEETSLDACKSNISQKDIELLKKSDLASNLPQPIKLNGFHSIDDYTPSVSDSEFNAETSSINSEDSEPLSAIKNKLTSKTSKKIGNYLKEPEFLKYMVMRQDALIDEHPELSYDQLVEYMYKTWQYEENSKSEIIKNDDIQQSGLVKGLNDNLRQKSIRNHFREKRKRIKKPSDDDATSISSDLSDIQVKSKEQLRKSPVVILDDCISTMSRGNSSEMKGINKGDTVSMNSDVSKKSPSLSLRKKKEENKDINEHNASNIVQEHIEDNKEKSSTDITSLSPTINDNSSGKKYFDIFNHSVNKDQNMNDDHDTKELENKINNEVDPETVSINSEASDVSVSKRKQRKNGEKQPDKDDPEFLKYIELRQDQLIDENPQLTQAEIISYLYKTWLYEESVKSDIKKSDDIEQANLVKGLSSEPLPPKKIRKKNKTEKEQTFDDDTTNKNKPKRKVSQPCYNEDYIDIDEDDDGEIELFDIFKPKNKLAITENGEVKTVGAKGADEGDFVEDEVELFFLNMTKPKPNVFKGLVREKVCDICHCAGNLVKCKGCHNMFHVDCAKKAEVDEVPSTPVRGRKKKKKPGRKPKNLDETESQSDEKSHDISEDNNVSIEEAIESESLVVDADNFEAVLSAKMQELIPSEVSYNSYAGAQGINWYGAVAGKCEIVDVKPLPKIDYSDFKCNNCLRYDVPVCFVCKKAVSKADVEYRQRCLTAHCWKYYHMECLDHWPQTQFNAGELSRNSKKGNERFEDFMCPRHVCHTCVSDDPRGCKTRFSGDKLARCVKCPATYHTFSKCVPAGTQILTGSHIVCPRHHERPGKVPCHVNAGWCFLCTLGGSLICCEYCPMSFHAECLDIKPPEGGYMCEDCETGRLPLYGEMVWVKLGPYRWWPGLILHPSEIPQNVMAVKHSPGEFVVRFFGQYDHYWVNRGRVFPFQEGDSGRISSQKSKIDADFTTAMEHAQRACAIMKTAEPNEEENTDIASSLLPPHYVKLKVNKPVGSLCGKRVDIEESSLTQCVCDPDEDEPCGLYSRCLNRMLLTECGPMCRAGDRCLNRAFEKRQYPRMAPYRTPHRGWGLRALEDVKAGQFVIEYVGELIDEEEFKRRMNRKHEIRDENFYFLTLDKERMIDAGPKGNLARFMNHCCEPNCETQKWTVLGDDRVGLFAMKDIPANSELTFNYNLQCAGIEKKKCLCGAKRCSGYMGAKPKQEETQPKKNKLLAKRTYKKRKNAEESPSVAKSKVKRPVGRPAKPRELSEIEKDLLIIKSATNGISSDSEGSGRLSGLEQEKSSKALKRKRVSFSTEENISPPTTKKSKLDAGD